MVSTEPDVVRDIAARYAHAAAQADLPDADGLVPRVPSRTDAGRRTMSLLRRFAAYADE